MIEIARDSPGAFADFPGALAFVAKDTEPGGETLGWCWGYLLPRPDATVMLYLHHLEVAASYRRRGIGRALLTAFVDAGAAQGATRMFLVTGEANLPARRLYESIGGTLAAQGPTVSYWFHVR